MQQSLFENIQSDLPQKPAFRIYDVSGSALYCGDCLDIMPLIPDKSVQLILADLPYGTTQNKWDSIIDLGLLWKQYERIIKKNGCIVLTAAQPFTSALVMSNTKLFKYDWTWRKPKGTGHLNAKKQPMRDKEDILVFYKNQCIYNPQMTEGKPYKEKSGWKGTKGYEGYGVDKRTGNDNIGFRYPKQVLEFGVVERGTLHPTEKPIELMKYLIKTYSNEGDMVLDNTMGSGTTCLAAKELNRKFIGIEKEYKYYKVAVHRLDLTHISDSHQGEICQICFNELDADYGNVCSDCDDTHFDD